MSSRLAAALLLVVGLSAGAREAVEWQLHVWEGSGWLGEGYAYVVSSTGRYAFYARRRSLDWPRCRLLTGRETSAVGKSVRSVIDTVGEAGFEAHGPCEDAGDLRVYVNWRDGAAEQRSSRVYLSECPSGVPAAVHRLVSLARRIHAQPSQECGVLSGEDGSSAENDPRRQVRDE